MRRWEGGKEEEKEEITIFLKFFRKIASPVLEERWPKSLKASIFTQLPANLIRDLKL